MTLSLVYVAVYVVLAGIASFIEVPVGRGFGAYQLNVLIRTGSLSAALVALVAVHGFALPALDSALAGLGIGLIAGLGSLFYCFALDYLAVSLVVTVSNIYIVITTLLGVVVLGEPVTALRVAGLVFILVGVVVLGHAPARYGVQPDATSRNTMFQLRPATIMSTYIVVIGVAAFLEKPALQGLDATQLNGLMAIAMTTVACVALAVRGPRLPMTNRTFAAFGIGAMIGVASVFYFLGLRGLPVSVTAASSNAYIVVTVLLSTVFLHQPLSLSRSGGVALTLLGVTALALPA